MLYKIQGLVALKSAQTNINFLLDAPDDKIARNLCSKYSIAVFTLEQYIDPPETFGKTYIRFLVEKETYSIYSTFEKAKDLFLLFHEAGMNITYINNLQRPISDADVVRVLEKLNTDYKIAHAPKDEKSKSYVTQFTNIVLAQAGNELNGVRKIASKAVEESELTISKMKPEELKTPYGLKVRTAVDELKRVKLGSNIVKIRDQMGLVYRLMEKVEMQNLEDHKENEIQVLEGSTVTYLDIVSERDKYKSTMNLQRAKAKGGGGFNYYVIFGAVGLYQKLLGKELKHKLNNIVTIINGLYDVMIIFIMMTIIWLVLLQLFNTIAYKGSFFTTAFIDIGIMGICSAILMKFKKPNLINLIIIGPTCVLLYFLLHSFIYANFGL